MEKDEFKQALKEYRSLLKRIREMGTPPHTDYWQHDLYDAEEKIYKSARM